jgi:hypothetical protein
MRLYRSPGTYVAREDAVLELLGASEQHHGVHFEHDANTGDQREVTSERTGEEVLAMSGCVRFDSRYIGGLLTP